MHEPAFWRCVWLGTGLAMLAGTVLRVSTVPAWAEPAPRSSELTPQQSERLAKAKALNQRVVELYGQGEYARAVPLAQEVAAIYRDVRGEQHPDYAQSLNNLASAYKAMSEFAKAEPLYRQALAIRKQVFGEQHPDYAQSLNNLAALYDEMGDYTKAEPLFREALAIRKKVLGEQHPAYATTLNNLAALYQDMGQNGKAEPLYVEALGIKKRVLGERDPSYATSLSNLGVLYDNMGDYARALPLELKALEIRKQVLGEQNPAYAGSLNNVADLYRSMGAFAKAEPLYRQAIKIDKNALGDQHPDYAHCLNNLAGMYEQIGDYARAYPLYHQAMEIRKQAFGEQHPIYAESLNDVGGLYELIGDYAKAEPLYRQAMEIDRKALGEQHPTYATALNNLAGLYLKIGDDTKAEPLYRQAMEIDRKALGEKHPGYAVDLNNLALLYMQLDDYAKAEPLFLQALELRRKALGERHPDFGISLNNLAALYAQMGAYAKAEPLIRQAGDVLKLSGERHPQYASQLNNLAVLSLVMGNDSQAVELSRQALVINRRSLNLTAAIQSERQQLVMQGGMRASLDGYLSFALAAHVPAPEQYDAALFWKGSVSHRQRQIRALGQLASGNGLTPDQRQQVTVIRQELETSARQLAQLTLSDPAPKQAADTSWRQQRDQRIEKLEAQVEQLQQRLADASDAYRQSLHQTSVAELVKSLPPDAALVDVLEYVNFSPPADHKGLLIPEQRLAAFVLRPGQPVERVELGAAKPIAQAVERWRQGYGAGDPGREAAAELLKRFWNPISERLAGAKLVLVSPDGALGRLPLGILPGKQPGHYLIEELAIVTLPVPEDLPQLLADPAKGDPTALLVGGIDYDAAEQSPPVSSGEHQEHPAARTSRGSHWDKLPGASEEADAVADCFTRAMPQAAPLRLAASGATKTAFERSAASSRFIHLATHGFFADASQRSALAPTAARAFAFSDKSGTLNGWHPGLLCGIVLAGANGTDGPERGILTALEVQELELRNVDLAVLSACETGLGASAGGEGLLGLQRAFQVAGAHSVIASLWQVDDRWTRALMVRFYENLLQKKMGKLEALREAQLWVLQQEAGPGELVGRGLKYVPGHAADKIGRLPPYYWAAFVLSGDWR